MTTELIQVSKLSKSALNVRRTVSKAACEELKASILAHGLMQNLVVTAAKKGRFHVIAGARRLEALQALIAEGKLPADYSAPCQIVTEEHAAEMSLAENTVRHAMHPADEFEAYAALVEDGQTAEQIGQRFGKSARYVEQRMKLARVAPELLAEYRAEKLTLEALMAFTVTDDHAKQLTVYEALDEWDLERPNCIRSRLTAEAVDADDKLVKFVGLDTYRAAGGTTKTDLFEEDVYLENPELLEALVTEKLTLAEQELKGEGWQWVKVDRDRDWQATQGCGRIQPQPVDAPPELLAELKDAEAAGLSFADQAEHEEDEDELDKLFQSEQRAAELAQQIRRKLEACARFDAEQKATAGCYAYIDHDGELEIRRGLVRRQDARQAAQEDAGTTNGDEAAAKPKGMPESLKRDLEAYRLAAAQAEIAMHPAIAFDLLVMTAARKVLQSRPVFDGADVAFNQHPPRRSVRGESLAEKRLEGIREGLPLDWLREKTEAAQLSAFQKLAEADKLRILAYCTAMTLKPKLAPGEGKQQTVFDAALAQTGANVAEYWRPTAANFLSRITTGQLLEIGAELFGQQWANSRRNSKKKDLVAELDRAFAQPEKALDPEKVRKIAAWLPEGMAFGTVKAEEPAKKGKAALPPSSEAETVTISLEGGKTAAVKAIVKGGLAAHKIVVEGEDGNMEPSPHSRYTVTHVNTGLKAYPSSEHFTSEKAAVEYMEQLLALGDWTFEDAREFPHDLRAAAFEIARATAEKKGKRKKAA